MKGIECKTGWDTVIRQVMATEDPADLLTIIRSLSQHFPWNSSDLFLYSEDLDSFFFPPETRGEPAEIRDALLEFADKHPEATVSEETASLITKFLASPGSSLVRCRPLMVNETGYGFLVLTSEKDSYCQEEFDSAAEPLVALSESAFERHRQKLEIKKLALENRLCRKNVITGENIKLLGEMIGGITHDLNNVFTGVSGFSQLLEMTATDEETLDSAREILKAADAGKQIISFISRTKKINPDEAERPFDVIRIIRNAAGAVAPLLKQSGRYDSVDSYFTFSMPESLEMPLQPALTEQIFLHVFSRLILSRADGINLSVHSVDAAAEVRISGVFAAVCEPHLHVITERAEDFPGNLLLMALREQMPMDYALDGDTLVVTFFPKQKELSVPSLPAGSKVLVFEPDEVVGSVFSTFLRQLEAKPTVLSTRMELKCVTPRILEESDRILMDVSGLPHLEDLGIAIESLPLVITSAWGKYLDFGQLEHDRVPRILIKPFTMDQLKRSLK